MSDNKPIIRLDAEAPEGFEGEGFFAVLTFVAVFFIAFIYVWKRGALDWDR